MENPQGKPGEGASDIPPDSFSQPSTPSDPPPPSGTEPLSAGPPANVPGRTPIEVYPDAAAQGGIANPPAATSAIDQWFLRNLAPLLIVFVSITLQLASDVIPRGKLVPRAIKAPTTDVTTDIETQAETESKSEAEASQTPPGPRTISDEAALTLVAPLVWLAGLLAMSALLVPAARQWIIGVLKNISVRPLPALRALDLVAVIFVWLTSARLLAIIFLGRFQLNSGEERALELIINGAGLLFSVMTAIFLARHRAGAKHGSNGIWPFWNLWRSNKRRSLWVDVLIGVICYPLSLLLVGICLYINQKLIQLIGHGGDQHPLIGDLTQNQSTGVLIVYFFMATAAAAIFEEIIFRGVLYNVLRRYFGSMAGAVGAAAIFAVIHFVWSQVLGLFILALILTWLYDRTGRLVAGITLHAVNNFVTLMITLFVHQPGS